MTYQVINYNAKAHVCHDQIKHLGYFDTKSEADKFAQSQPAHGGEIIVRKSDHKY